VSVLGAKAGGAQGAVDIRYANLPSRLASGGSVNVLVERMPSTNAYVSARPSSPTAAPPSPATRSW
jgi:hypothetical protein